MTESPGKSHRVWQNGLPGRVFRRLKRIPGNRARHRPLDPSPFPGGTVLVTGSGRSGTTWLAEILLAAWPARYIFEPFHPHQSPESRSLGGRRYVPADTRDFELEALLERILRGKIHNKWVNRFNRRVISHRRLVKAIRVNLMLRWICTRHPGLKIILIIRHPCAMANSYTELNLRPPMEEYLVQPDLVRDYLNPFVAEFREPESLFQAHLLRWALEQAVALDGLEPCMGIHILFYEHLCLHPGLELERLREYLGRPPNAALYRFLDKPSALSHAGSAVRTGADRVFRWRDEVSPENISMTPNILRRFGLDGLYGPDGLPATPPGEPPRPYRY